MVGQWKNIMGLPSTRERKGEKRKKEKRKERTMKRKGKMKNEKLIGHTAIAN